MQAGRVGGLLVALDVAHVDLHPVPRAPAPEPHEDDRLAGREPCHAPHDDLERVDELEGELADDGGE
jgi:hypothetical protein